MRDRLPGPVLLNCVRVRQRLRDLRVRRQIALNVRLPSMGLMVVSCFS